MFCDAETLFFHHKTTNFNCNRILLHNTHQIVSTSKEVYPFGFHLTLFMLWIKRAENNGNRHTWAGTAMGRIIPQKEESRSYLTNICFKWNLTEKKVKFKDNICLYFVLWSASLSNWFWYINTKWFLIWLGRKRAKGKY